MPNRRLVMINRVDHRDELLNLFVIRLLPPSSDFDDRSVSGGLTLSVFTPCAISIMECVRIRNDVVVPPCCSVMPAARILNTGIRGSRTIYIWIDQSYHQPLVRFLSADLRHEACCSFCSRICRQHRAHLRFLRARRSELGPVSMIFLKHLTQE